MRILLLNSEFPPVGGGAGNASAHLARALTELGHTVTVVTAHFRGMPQVETQQGVTIFRIAALRRKQDRSNALEQVVFIVAASLWVLWFARRLNPQVTLAFFGMPSGVVAWLLKKIAGVPYLVSLRGGDVPGFRPYDFKIFHKIMTPVLRLVWKNASAVVANSRGLQDLARAFEPRMQIPVVPNGVDAMPAADTERMWTPPRLLSAGRIVHQKGLDLGMRALAHLKDLNWHWTIAGDGPQLEMLKQLAMELGIADRVTFLGWQGRTDLLKWYHHANIFLFPSRHEGMPNAVLEAMASGLPVVATRIAGSEELVLDAQTGFLTPSEDVQALHHALRTLLSDPALRQRMGAAARQRVEREYTWQNVAQAYQTLLKKAIQKENLL